MLHSSSERAPPPQQQQITLGQILRAQYTDPESWAANKVVLTAFGTFAAAVAAIAAFGDMLVPVGFTPFLCLLLR
ncbi:hypothetical protein NBRC10512_001915 [Rhodotorula toruloides]|nr:hypothetical protein OF846_003346 [Rhodotorula toruloides]